jgi:uncharacterized protein YaaQ
MKLILAVIQQKDETDTIEKLNEQNFIVTKLTTTGGFLKEKNVTLLTGVEDADVDKAIECIKSTAKTRKTVSYTVPCNGMSTLNPILQPVLTRDVTIGGCTIFVLPVDQIVKH